MSAADDELTHEQRLLLAIFGKPVEPPTHDVTLVRITRGPHVGPAYKPRCTCGTTYPFRPTPDVETAREWASNHIQHATRPEETPQP